MYRNKKKANSEADFESVMRQMKWTVFESYETKNVPRIGLGRDFDLAW